MMTQIFHEIASFTVQKLKLMMKMFSKVDLIICSLPGIDYAGVSTLGFDTNVDPVYVKTTSTSEDSTTTTGYLYLTLNDIVESSEEGNTIDASCFTIKLNGDSDDTDTTVQAAEIVNTTDEDGNTVSQVKLTFETETKIAQTLEEAVSTETFTVTYNKESSSTKQKLAESYIKLYNYPTAEISTFEGTYDYSVVNVVEPGFIRIDFGK